MLSLILDLACCVSVGNVCSVSHYLRFKDMLEATLSLCVCMCVSVHEQALSFVYETGTEKPVYAFSSYTSVHVCVYVHGLMAKSLLVNMKNRREVFVVISSDH